MPVIYHAYVLPLFYLWKTSGKRTDKDASTLPLLRRKNSVQRSAHDRED